MQAPSSISVFAARGLISNAEDFVPVSCEMFSALGLSQDAEGFVPGEPGVCSALGLPQAAEDPVLGELRDVFRNRLTPGTEDPGPVLSLCAIGGCARFICRCRSL